jgi:hypothetical protein
VTEQPQNGPTGQSGAESEPAGDMPAALGPDAPTDVHPATEPGAPAAPAAEPPAVSPPPPPPPPPSIATAMDSQDVSVPPPAAPLESGDSPAVSAPPVAPSWRPEDEPSAAATLAAERPEIAVGAAFTGGLVLALILKRLAR